jgi:hypothetical protein
LSVEGRRYKNLRVEDMVLSFGSLSASPLTVSIDLLDVSAPEPPDERCLAFFDERARSALGELGRN